MRHCSNCHYCIVDMKPLVMLGIYIKKCKLKDKHILHPFWSGFRCRRWRKEKRHE